MKVMIERETDDFVVEGRAPNWDWAAVQIAKHRWDPPAGYKMLSGCVDPRTRDDGSIASGQRCNLTLKFQKLTKGKAMSEAEVFDYFKAEGLE